MIVIKRKLKILKVAINYFYSILILINFKTDYSEKAEKIADAGEKIEATLL